MLLISNVGIIVVCYLHLVLTLDEMTVRRVDCIRNFRI